MLAFLLFLSILAAVQAALTGAPFQRGQGFDERRYELWANNLYANGYYGESATTALAREELRSVPLSAYVPPGYPFMLVALKELHADTPAVRRGVQAAFVGLTVLFIGLIAFWMFGPIAAVVSQLFLIATAVLAIYAQFTLSESLATITFIGALGLFVVGLRRRSWPWFLGAGLIFGYSILTRPQILLLPLPLAIYVLVAEKRRRHAVILGAIFLAASYGVVAPWTIRNEMRLHAFAPVASYTWYNFWEVNNPLANGLFINPERRLPDFTRELRTHNEVIQDTTLRRIALKWVRQNPAKAVKGWVRDVAIYLYKPDPNVVNLYTIHGWHAPRLDERVLIALALIAVVVGFLTRRRWPHVGIPIILLVYFIGFFAFFLPNGRYRVTLIPIYALLAAGLVEMATQFVLERRSRHKQIEHAGTSQEVPAAP
jgi:4-amino-4-deoxy-L-arabinose transferase-like glycosyltransferase